MMTITVSKKFMTGIVVGLVLALLIVVTALAVPFISDGEQYCLDELLGTWLGGGDEFGTGGICQRPDGTCEEIVCDDGWCTNSEVACPGTEVAAPKTSGRRPSGCKLIDLDDSAAIGTTITATYKGTAQTLRLSCGGTFYFLPIVPGSVKNVDGKYTAQFYTSDPLTGEALLPAGSCKATCFGPTGTRGGAESITIKR